MFDTLFNNQPTLPILTTNDVDRALKCCEVLEANQYQAVEITLRTPNALNILQQCSQQFPNLMIAAGTILTTENLFKAHDCGAKFCISPGFDTEVFSSAEANSIPYLPGVSTVSEVMHVFKLGGRWVKVFPISLLGGVQFTKAINAVMPMMNLVVTGGVSSDSDICAYLSQENVKGVGLSSLLPKELVSQRNWSKLMEHCQRTPSSYCI